MNNTASVDMLRQIALLIDNSETILFSALSKEVGECIVTFCNPLSVAVAIQCPEYLDFLKRFDAVFADGILLAKTAQKVQKTTVPRLSFDGNSLAIRVFEKCKELNLRVAVVGGVDGVAKRAASRLADNMGLDVKYIRNGYFSSEQSLISACMDIIALDIDVVIVGMGVPYQEKFLITLRSCGFLKVGVTCGGYLDQIAQSGLVYYPEVVNRLHLRAVYRVIKEPRRLIKRYILHYRSFYFAAMKLALLR